MKLLLLFALCSAALASVAVSAASNRKSKDEDLDAVLFDRLLDDMDESEDGECETPLDSYVNAPDSNYGYQQLKVYKQDDCTIYVLNMTSQRWLPDGICDRPIWWHYMCVVVPDQLRQRDSAIIYVDEYLNIPTIPPATDKFLALAILLAKQTGAIVADLKSVPNMPIVFYDDPTKKARKENAVLTWTFKKFLENPNDPTILALLPMTKAIVRAMDTVQDFAKTTLPSTNIGSFMVLGYSKRGWATWLSAVVDKRVKAIVPVVYDALNFNANMHHHFRAYGGWSFALVDFFTDNITLHLDDPITAKMLSIVDPYAYLNRLTLPKMVISAAGDQAFVCDDASYWYADIQGETHLRIVPNTEHLTTGREVDITMSVAAFFLSVVQDYPRPQFTWQLEKTDTGGMIVVVTEDTPTNITVYRANTISSTRRDFRLAVKNPITGGPSLQPIVWSSSEVENLGGGIYVAEFDNPATGWLGFFVELQFAAPENNKMVFTTEMMIIPDTFPFPDCHGASCAGSLV